MLAFTLYCAVKFTGSCGRKPASSGQPLAGGSVQVPPSPGANAASMKYAFQFHCVVFGFHVEAGVTTIKPYLSAIGCQPQFSVMMACGSKVEVYFVPCNINSIGGFAGMLAGR